MRPPRASPRPALCLGVIAALLVSGCALTSKSEPSVPRYFSPERPEALRAVPRTPGPRGELRLGHVSGASYLDERVVFRDSEYELGYYQERRWTEAPDQYLRRRLARVLFEERGIQQVVGGAALTLELELTAFEEIRAPKRVGRVTVTARLRDQRAVRWEETLTSDQPVTAAGKGGPAEAMVEAVGLALRAIVERIADRVGRELAAPPPAPAEARASRPPSP